jgi:hypothetical protein
MMYFVLKQWYGREVMPVFHDAGPEAKGRLMTTSIGYQQRQVYRDNLGKLSEGQICEVEPETGETLRKLKVNVRRAANELDMNVRYGETREETLLIWSEAPRERRRRGRPRKVAS